MKFVTQKTMLKNVYSGKAVGGGGVMGGGRIFTARQTIVQYLFRTTKTSRSDVGETDVYLRYLRTFSIQFRGEIDH